MITYTNKLKICFKLFYCIKNLVNTDQVKIINYVLQSVPRYYVGALLQLLRKVMNYRSDFLINISYRHAQGLTA